MALSRAGTRARSCWTRLWRSRRSCGAGSGRRPARRVQGVRRPDREHQGAAAGPVLHVQRHRDGVGDGRRASRSARGGSRRRADSHCRTRRTERLPGPGRTLGWGHLLRRRRRRTCGEELVGRLGAERDLRRRSGEGGGHGSGGEQQGGTLALGLPDVALNAVPEHGSREHGMAPTSKDDTTPWNAGPMGPGAKQSAADRAYWSRMASALEELCWGTRDRGIAR